MDACVFVSPSLRNWLATSALAPHIETLVERLARDGYSCHTIAHHGDSIAHFARWMSRSRLKVEHIDEAAIQRFLDRHLPRCDCPPPAHRVRRDLSAGCNLLLRILRDQGVVPAPVAKTDPVEDELRRFDEHMRCARGLCDGTRRLRIGIVRRLLQARFGDQPIVISDLQPADVRRFIASQGKGHSVANAHALASALRAYFCFRATCGDPVHALTGVIATPAHWSLASLPRSLTRSEVERLLASFTPQVRSYRRGYAIVRCALDLGLRVGEIAKLSLDDIDWRAATVRLRRTKSRREDSLPLPPATGRAIADYLRFERPTTANRAVFVRHVAPRDVPISAYAIHRVVRDAYCRVGITHGRVHALRHTFARQLLERGSSLKEVAEVLRHRSLNTSLIYAKLDHRNLAAVALPWPGSVS
jgi:integrase/recombinase XerC